MAHICHRCGNTRGRLYLVELRNGTQALEHYSCIYPEKRAPYQ
jgi:hypothetical protein